MRATLIFDCSLAKAHGTIDVKQGSAQNSADMHPARRDARYARPRPNAACRASRVRVVVPCRNELWSSRFRVGACLYTSSVPKHRARRAFTSRALIVRCFGQPSSRSLRDSRWSFNSLGSCVRGRRGEARVSFTIWRFFFSSRLPSGSMLLFMQATQNLCCVPDHDLWS
jgi:hypothetical protein